MTEYTCQICDWDDAETVAALRSHVAAKKDEAHQEARREKAWTEWTAEDTQPSEGGKGGSEGGSTTPEKGGSDPSTGVGDEEPPSTPSETTEGEGEATPSEQGGSDPSEGGPDPSEEYEQQWTAENTQDKGGSEGGPEGGSDPSEGGSDPSDPEGTDIGAGAALVAGSVFVGLLVLLTRGEDRDEPIEVESEVEDVDDSDAGGFSTVQGGSEGASEGGSWG